MSNRNVFAGTILNVFRLLFVFLLIAVVLLFILAKSGGSAKDEEAAAEEEVQDEVVEGEFGKGWTDLKYRVKYHWAGGKLKYELFIHPYDRRVEKLRRGSLELVLLSFVDAERSRVAPLKAPARIEMRDLELVVDEVDGRKVARGWIHSAEVTREDGADTKIAGAEMGWLFSNDLLALLRDLRKERLIREAQKRAQEARQASLGG